MAQFNAIAADPSSDAIAGQTVAHTYADNGTYTATLTVTDSHGASTTQTCAVIVANAAPVVDAGIDRTLNET